MNVSVQQGGIQTVEAEAIVVNLFKGVTEPTGATGVVNKALAGAISELIEAGDLKGKFELVGRDKGVSALVTFPKHT